MTTIACTLDAMGSDSKSSVGGVSYPTHKIYRIRGALIGCAGDNPAIMKFIHWYKGGHHVEDVPELGEEEDLNAAILTKDGIFSCDRSFVFEKVDRKHHAVGTGGAFALSALHLGHSLREAVETACELDNESGGPVRIEPLRRPRGHPKT